MPEAAGERAPGEEAVVPAADAAPADAPAEAHDAAAAGAAGDAAGPSVVDYRVMQGKLFKKPGTKPETNKILQLERKVGEKVKTTGKTWTGPSGGIWVELDPSAQKPGWMLVEGPGFNMAGPLLERVEPGEEESIVLFVLSPLDDSHLCDVCLKPSQSVRHAKNWIALRMPGLKPEKITVAREKPSDKTHGMGLRNFPANWIIPDDARIRDTPFKNGDELVYFYMGDAGADIEEAKEKLAATGGSSS